jgi:hypothetical protein
VYIDDVIVFSLDIDSYKQHLSTVLSILYWLGVTLSLLKYYFVQLGLKALGHFVSRYGLLTVEEKTEAIRALEFLKNL